MDHDFITDLYIGYKIDSYSLRNAVSTGYGGVSLDFSMVKGNPNGECFIRIEQPRGEAIYYTKGNGTKYLNRFRLRTPTTSNIPPMLDLLKGCQLGDVPLLILTIDPCISCTER